jgi:hypothetical protein
MNRSWLVHAAWFVSLVACSGCGGSKTYQVEGVVLFRDGTPLSGGLVSFELIGDGPAREQARGEIQADGTFVLSTFQKGDGALPGRHRVWITPPLPDAGEDALQKKLIAPQFERPETSGLERTVEAKKNRFTIEIDRP